MALSAILVDKAIAFPAKRHLAIDALRGFFIVVMALDHANYFVAQRHSSGEYWGGPFPSYDNALPFLTRLVTHFAAPGFFMLMGVGMVLFANARRRKGWSHWAVMRHFWFRGALLIILQLLLVNRAWELSPQGWGLQLYVGVLFALGGTMILATVFLWLDTRLLIAVTTILFVGPQFFHPDPNQWNFMVHEPTSLLFLYPGGDQLLWSNYPIVPWLALVTFGLLFGKWLIAETDDAYRRGLKLGGAFLLIFLLLRYLDGAGNIRPLAGDGWIDFFNLVKYPPSITFALFTTGVNLVLLWFFHRIAVTRAAILLPLATFGRTPLFFYLVHLFLYAGLGRLFAPEGSSIPEMIPIWLLGLVILFPFCVLYAQIRNGRPVNLFLRYL